MADHAVWRSSRCCGSISSASSGERWKKRASNSSTPLIKPPHLLFERPSRSPSLAYHFVQSQRSQGTSTMESTLSARFRQYSSISLAPGNRPAMPTTAIDVSTVSISIASLVSEVCPERGVICASGGLRLSDREDCNGSEETVSPRGGWIASPCCSESCRTTSPSVPHAKNSVGETGTPSSSESRRA